MTFPTVALGEIFEIARGGSPRPIDDFITEEPDGVNWISISDASGSSKFITKTARKITRSGVSRSRSVKPGDFLLTNSMSFGRPYIMATSGCIHDGWLVLSPRKEGVDSNFMYHLLGSPSVYAEFKRLAPGATVKNLNIDLVSGVKIPVPPFDEQRRIAAILDEADALRRKRREAIDLLDELPLSIFNARFGDPTMNSKQIASQPLGSVAKFESGGTPSKARDDYWNGSVPWVSPKDMKRLRIWEAEDTISDVVFQETALKKVPPDTPLIVVRGMILAHTVPIAMAMTELAINQDMKSIHFDERILPEFGLWCLKALHRSILAKVDTAAHGTKRLDIDALRELPILVPSLDDQQSFARAIETWERQRQHLTAQARELDTSFAALQYRAFRGKL